MAFTLSTAASTLAAEVGLSARIVMLGSSSRCDSLDRSRPVAMTDRPRFWNATASAEPMPPALQPVIKTYLGAIVSMCSSTLASLDTLTA